MSTNAEYLVGIGLVVAEIFRREICQFLSSHQKGAVVTLAISGVTGRISQHCKAAVWYSGDFWSPSYPNIVKQR